MVVLVLFPESVGLTSVMSLRFSVSKLGQYPDRAFLRVYPGIFAIRQIFMESSC